MKRSAITLLALIISLDFGYLLPLSFCEITLPTLLAGETEISNETFEKQTANPQIGDPGGVLDESRLDPRFPEMREWAKAGVVGGIPLRNTLEIKFRLQPGEDLQAAIDQVALSGGGVVLLEPGDHRISKTIKMKSGVVVRGADKEQTVVKIVMKAPFFKISGGKPATAIEINMAERVGLEDLTFRYAAVDFEPIDKEDFNAPWERSPFHEVEARDHQLFVNMIVFADSRNCWVDNCNLLWAGAHSIGLANCQHMTMRNNFIDRAYVKKDSMHGGYYGVWGTSYSLFYNEKVRRIRHFALMSRGCRYNVVYRCDMEVDINFHDKDDGQNLVEKTLVATPVWHSWDAIGIGAQGKHDPPGPRNFLFDNIAISKGVEGYNRRGPISEPGKIYEVTKEFGKPIVSELMNEAPPLANTLYVVKRLEDQ